MLSPLDEDSSGDSDRNGSVSTAQPASDFKVLTSTDSEIEGKFFYPHIGSSNRMILELVDLLMICMSSTTVNYIIIYTEVFVLETEENSPPSAAGLPYNIDLHLELNLSLNDLSEEATKSSPPGSMKSPTIPIPKRIEGGKLAIGFNSIGCHVGSKTSSEGVSFSNSYAGNAVSLNKTAESTCAVNVENISNVVVDCETENMPENDVEDDAIRMDLPLQRLVPIDCKVSEMSAESVIWLSHRLGPVLTARYLSRNLLRMLTLCYAGTENLKSLPEDEIVVAENGKWSNRTLVGDRNACKVLECLTAIAGL